MANVFDQFDNTNGGSAPTTGSNITPQQQPDSINGKPKQNIFDQFDNSQNAADSQAVPNQSDSNDSGALMAGLENMNRMFGRVAEGGIDLFARAVGSDLIRNKIASQQMALDKSAAAAAEKHPVAAKVGEVAGALGATAPLIAGGAGLAASTAAAEGFGYLSTPVNASEEEKAKNALIGGALNLAVPTAVTGLAAGAKDLGSQSGKLISKSVDAVANSLADTAAIIKPGEQYNLGTVSSPGLLKRTFMPQKAARQALAQKVEQSGGLAGAQDNLQAAKNVGVYQSPAEAFPNDNMSSFIKGTKVNDNNKGILTQMVERNDTKLNDQVKQMFDKIVPEGVEQAQKLKDNLYAGLNKIKLSPQKFEELNQNPSIATRIQDLSKTVDLPKNIRNADLDSYAVLNAVKKDMDGDIWGNKIRINGKERDMSSTEKAGIKEARDQLIETMDAEYPGYADARKIAERLTIQGKYNQAIKEISEEAGSKGEVSLDKLYTKLFNTEEKRNNLFQQLESAGGDVNHAKDILTVIDAARKSPINTLIKSVTPEGREAYAGNGPVGLIQSIVDKFTTGRYNKQLINLFTNNNTDWQKQVGKVFSRKTIGDRVAGLSNFLHNMPVAKGAAASIGDRVAGLSNFLHKMPVANGAAASNILRAGIKMPISLRDKNHK